MRIRSKIRHRFSHPPLALVRGEQEIPEPLSPRLRKFLNALRGRRLIVILDDKAPETKPSEPPTPIDLTVDPDDAPCASTLHDHDATGACMPDPLDVHEPLAEMVERADVMPLTLPADQDAATFEPERPTMPESPKAKKPRKKSPKPE